MMLLPSVAALNLLSFTSAPFAFEILFAATPCFHSIAPLCSLISHTMFCEDLFLFFMSVPARYMLLQHFAIGCSSSSCRNFFVTSYPHWGRGVLCLLCLACLRYPNLLTTIAFLTAAAAFSQYPQEECAQWTRLVSLALINHLVPSQSHWIFPHLISVHLLTISSLAFLCLFSLICCSLAGQQSYLRTLLISSFSIFCL